jgi:hypothetical protein
MASIIVGYTYAYPVHSPLPPLLFRHTILAGHILKSTKRVFGIPVLKYYALGDGLSNIFSRYPGQLMKPQVTKVLQLKFGFG